MNKKITFGFLFASLIAVFIYFAFEKGNRKGCFPLEENIAPINIVQNQEGEIHIIVLGDTGGENEEYRQNQLQIADTIKDHCENEICDFALLLGDNFYPSGVNSSSDQKFIHSFEKVYQDIDIPFMTVLGNHDVRLNSFAQVEYTLNSHQWKMPNYYYQFEVGNAQFTAVNTNCDIYSWYEQYILGYILDWSSDKKWQIFFGHHPIYSSGTHGDANILIRWFWEEFFADDVDIYLAGHNHLLQLSVYQDKKTVYAVSGSGSKFYKDQAEKDRSKTTIATSQFLYHGLGFIKLIIKQNQAEFLYFDKNGTMIYSYTQKKV